MSISGTMYLIYVFRGPAHSILEDYDALVLKNHEVSIH